MTAEKQPEKIELLAPAGNLEKGKIAVLYGADAVYIGGQEFSLRSRASNFTVDQIAELADFAHEHGSRVHVTVNMLPHPEDLEGLDEYLLALDKAGVDALIIASAGILQRARELNIKPELHLSTQHSTTNSSAIDFWKEQGVDRVVLARENGMDSIREIAKASSLPLEVFIHGGMCISFSGRCVLSNHMTNRDANRGGCAQSCRWKYHLYDSEKPDHTELSNPDNLFSMSSRDLQAVDYIEEMMDLGIASLKIEGRMKSAYYLATVISSYRRLIDHIYETGHAEPEFLEMIKREIAKAENRPTGPGFYAGAPDNTVQLYRPHDETVTQEYIAQIVDFDENSDEVILQVKNKFSPNIDAEIFGPHIEPENIQIGEVRDMDGNLLEVCNRPMQLVKTSWKGPKEKEAMLRKLLK